MNKTNENKSLDLMKAAVLGHAVGDALGVPVEFATRKELDESPVTDMEGFGTYAVPAGSWSDDTSMTLCTLDAMAHMKFTLDGVMKNFGRWYYKDAFTPTGELFDVGNTCGSAIDRYFEEKTDTLHCGLDGERDNGNGSLMRILPFALLYPFDLDMIEAASALTHAHERSKLACKIYSMLVGSLLNLPPSKYIVEVTLHLARERFGQNPEWRHFDRLIGIENLGRGDIKSTGYVVDTLEAAVWCLLTTDSYRECVLKAVNLGDDTDTVAAVAGGLAGIMYGLDSIPAEWLNTLKKRDYIEMLCEKAYTARTLARGGGGIAAVGL